MLLPLLLYLLAFSLLLLLALCIQSLLFAFHFHGNACDGFQHPRFDVFHTIYYVLLHVRRCFNAVRSNAGNWFKFGMNELDVVCLALTQNFDAISCVYNIYKYTNIHKHLNLYSHTAAGRDFFLFSPVYFFLFSQNSHSIPVAKCNVSLSGNKISMTQRILIPFTLLVNVIKLLCFALAPVHPYSHTHARSMWHHCDAAYAIAYSIL